MFDNSVCVVVKFWHKFIDFFVFKTTAGQSFFLKVCSTVYNIEQTFPKDIFMRP